MRLYFSAVACALLSMGFVTGCKKEADKQLVEMPNPPAFGSAPDLKTLQGFAVGKWGLKMLMDPNVVKQEHVEGVATQEAEEGVTDYFTFKADGSFVCRLKGFKPKIDGTWTVNNDFLALTFTKIDGKEIQPLMDEVHKNEEHGGQGAIVEAALYDGVKGRIDNLNSWRLGKDQKTFVIPVDEGSLLSGAISGDGNTLVRMSVDSTDQES